MINQQIHKIEIEKDLSAQDQRAIEVTITLSNGECRWCYFMNPIAFQNCGYWIEGTKTPIHYGAQHMIVVAATLTEELIYKALRFIEKKGDILNCTISLDDISKAEHIE